MSTISEFRNAMQRGGFRPNQFRVTILFPAIVNGGTAAGAATRFLAKSAQLPESSVAPVEVQYRGRSVKFAGERTFQPWQIDVYSDADFSVRNAFEAWIDSMQKSDSTAGTLLPATYQTDMLVEALDRNDRVIKTYKFINAFPVSVGVMQLDWEANNQIGMFPVTFEYNHFISVGAEGTNVG